jgi:hypothetical protein
LENIMKAKFANPGLEWNDAGFRRVANMRVEGAMIPVAPKFPTGILVAKFYRAERSHVIHCALWVGDRRGWGTAGGWGYHKHSAALDEAIRRASIELYGNPYGDGYGDEHFPKGEPVHIDGRGVGAMHAALEAIARVQSGGSRNIRIIDI